MNSLKTNNSEDKRQEKEERRRVTEEGVKMTEKIKVWENRRENKVKKKKLRRHSRKVLSKGRQYNSWRRKDK